MLSFFLLRINLAFETLKVENLKKIHSYKTYFITVYMMKLTECKLQMVNYLFLNDLSEKEKKTE
jgi:hypothetical protein